MQKRVFITGAAGFIGFHLSRHLLARGDVVIGYDNFSNYYNPQLKRAREEILKKEGASLFEGDICDRERMLEIVRSNKITHIVHLAAQAGVRYSLINPGIYTQTNIEGFMHVLEVCRENPEIVLTYASSSSVYGNNTQVPFAEADPVELQASLYGVTKRSNELMAQAYHHLYGIRVTGLRFFTVYGPWGRPDMAYFSFTDKIRSGEPIDLFNHGKMERDFTYIDDIVDGTASAIDLGASCELFNLGNNRPEQLKDLVAALENALGRKAKIRLLPMQPGDVVVTYADISKSVRMLGFNPQIPLAEGILRFVEWKSRFALPK